MIKMKRQHIKLKNTPQVKKYNQALRRASKNKMNKRKKELRENITYLVRRAVERSLLVGKEPAIANYSKNLISLFDQALQAKEEEMVEKFSEFCHTKYKGCSQASGEWEYSYEGEVITMAEEFLSSLKKGETK